MARDWTCPQCHAANAAGARACEGCGQDRTTSARDAAPMAACPIDDARLQADGWCPTGNGYVVYKTCPFACPHCRRPLSWDGGCPSCYGAPSGRREDWSFPGHRYELEGGHWVRIAGLEPGRLACTEAENQAGLDAVRRALAAAPALAGRSERTRAQRT